MIFISAPYGNAPDKEERRKLIAQYSARLMRLGYHVICPMTLGLALSEEAELPTDTQWWLDWTLNLLTRCDVVSVLAFPNWKSSVGVAAEIKLAEELGIPIDFEYI